MVDSHVNAYVRFKLALTEDNPTIRTYEEALWAELPDGKTAPVEGSLAILDALHARWVSFLRGLEPADFARPLVYPGVGDVTVDLLLEIYGWHGPHHEAHVTTAAGARGGGRTPLTSLNVPEYRSPDHDFRYAPRQCTERRGLAGRRAEAAQPSPRHHGGRRGASRRGGSRPVYIGFDPTGVEPAPRQHGPDHGTRARPALRAIRRSLSWEAAPGLIGDPSGKHGGTSAAIPSEDAAAENAERDSGATRALPGLRRRSRTPARMLKQSRLAG